MGSGYRSDDGEKVYLKWAWIITMISFVCALSGCVRMKNSDALGLLNREFDASWTPQWSSVSGMWHMNGTIGTIGATTMVVDSSGQGQDGEVFGAGPITIVPGKLNQAIELDATTLASLIHFPPTSQTSCDFMSAAFWFKSTTPPPGNTAFFWKSLFGGTPGYVIYPQNTGNSLLLDVTTTAGNAIVSWNSNDNFFDGNWHHIAFTLNSSIITVYKDGGVDNSGSYLVGSGFCSPTSVVSAFAYGQMYFDELALWNSALSPADVQTIYLRQSSF